MDDETTTKLLLGAFIAIGICGITAILCAFILLLIL